MSNNLGNDIMLSQDGDFIIASNGDLYTTVDEEFFGNYPFEGYVAIRQFVFIALQSVAGEYNPFDIDFGAGAELLISRNLIQEFESFQERVQNTLLSDSRISSVTRIEYEYVETNIVNIYIDIIVVGQNVKTEFVYPFILG